MTWTADGLLASHGELCSKHQVSSVTLESFKGTSLTGFFLKRSMSNIIVVMNVVFGGKWAHLIPAFDLRYWRIPRRTSGGYSVFLTMFEQCASRILTAAEWHPIRNGLKAAPSTGINDPFLKYRSISFFQYVLY